MSQPKITVDQHATALAVNLPSGRVWAPKFQQGSNLFKLLRGMAPTFRSMDSALQRFVDQSYPPETEDYLDEWEAALGLPDSCFSVTGDDDSRRFTIQIKLLSLNGVQTEADFVNLALLFGLTITVNSGIEHLRTADGGYGTALPEMVLADFLLASVKGARFTMVVVETFPESVTFPWIFQVAAPTGLRFTSSARNSLRCLIGKLAPANVDVIFKEAP